MHTNTTYKSRESTKVRPVLHEEMQKWVPRMHDGRSVTDNFPHTSAGREGCAGRVGKEEGVSVDA